VSASLKALQSAARVDSSGGLQMSINDLGFSQLYGFPIVPRCCIVHALLMLLIPSVSVSLVLGTRTSLIALRSRSPHLHRATSEGFLNSFRGRGGAEGLGGSTSTAIARATFCLVRAPP